jgi:hypothetical protein
MLMGFQAAHADFSTDAQTKTVVCKAPQMIVKINQDRTQITVIDLIDPDHSEKYSVNPSKKVTDGDTFISYDGVEVSPDPETFVTLSLNDQGDSITFRHDTDEDAPIALDCK